MAKNYSSRQSKIIGRYYDNIDTIMVNRLGSIVSDLFLADTEAKQNRLWGRANDAMTKAKVDPKKFRHIIEARDLNALATLVNELA